jgi:Domain of unknown function (DUF6457)
VDWLDEYAEVLGVGALSDEERRVLLRLAREVAHRTERPFAPLSTYLAGRYAAARGDGQDAGAVRDALRMATELLPPEA